MSDSTGHLHQRFRPPGAFGHDASALRPLPFDFLQLDQNRYVAVNMVGEHVVLKREALVALVDGTLTPEHEDYRRLRERHFFLDGYSDVALELLAAKYRTKHSRLADLAGLHLFVTTLRCDHSCPYCQVSRVSVDKRQFDMSIETADQAIRLMFESPSPALKVEFQGGESTLNWPLIQHIVARVTERNSTTTPRNVAFVIATNLATISDEMLEYCGEHEILISTSLDGPEWLHNKNRPRPGSDSYQRTIDGIKRARSYVGRDRVGALLTTTSATLDAPQEVVDEYVKQGFHSIFLRPISPYGFALKTTKSIGYDTARFNHFFDTALDYIISLNRRGYTIVEEYTALILRRLMTPYDTGYVDLRSPAGAGLGALVYNYDGRVFASDEGRMLAEIGDRTFCLGRVDQTFNELMHSPGFLKVLNDSMVECTPGCSDCAFNSVCGTDPVYHHATQGNYIGHRPTSGFCARNMHAIKSVVRRYEDDASAREVFETWLERPC